uniref:Uncharacterized protein n=1 Tax=Solanum lycopersicum TaxID=4081 RepID=A0A3Q7I004_SOLLC
MPYKNSSEVIAAMFSLAFYFLPCLKVYNSSTTYIRVPVEDSTG